MDPKPPYFYPLAGGGNVKALLFTDVHVDLTYTVRVFTCSASAGQQLMRNVVAVVLVGTKLNYLQCCGALVLMGVLIVLFVVGLTIEICIIDMDDHFGHRLPLVTIGYMYLIFAAGHCFISQLTEGIKILCNFSPDQTRIAVIPIVA